MGYKRRRSKNSQPGIGALVFLFVILVIAAGTWQLTTLGSNTIPGQNNTPVSFSRLEIILIFLIIAEVIIFALGGLYFFAKSYQRKKRHKLIYQRLYSLSPIEFEHACTELFEQIGYSAKTTRYKKDKGIDIVITRNGKRHGAQCKRYALKNPVRVNEMRDFIGALDCMNAEKKAYFITTGYFTSYAREAAAESSFDIELIDKNRLGKWQELVVEKNIK